MKTMTLVAYNRPAYTAETLASIENARGFDTYKLYIALEPGNKETRDVVINFCQRHQNTVLIENPLKLGCNWNNKCVYDRIIAEGSEFNVAIEDDTPITIDALELADWFFKHPKRDDYLFLQFFSLHKVIERELEIMPCSMFSAWGWCFTKEKYEKEIEPYWMCNPMGWDFSITSYMEAASVRGLRPILSRSRNVGRELGTYCSPKIWDATFPGLVVSDGSYGTN